MTGDPEETIERWLREQAERERRLAESSPRGECERTFEAGCYAEHSLTPAAARAFEQHLGGCARCSELVATLATGLVGRPAAADIGAAPAVLAAAKRRRQRLRLVRAATLVAAATLLGVLLYQGQVAKRHSLHAEVTYVGVLRSTENRVAPQGFQVVLRSDTDAYLCGFLWHEAPPHGQPLLNGFHVKAADRDVLPAPGQQFPLPPGNEARRLYLIVTADPIDPDAFTSWLTGLSSSDPDRAAETIAQFARDHDAQLVMPAWPDPP